MTPASSGTPPPFGGGGGDLHDRVAQEMFALYRSKDAPSFLPPPARALLAEGRAYFARRRLAEIAMIEADGVLWLFPWVGTIRLNTLMLALRRAGLDANIRGVALELSFGADRADALIAALRALAAAPPPDPRALAAVCKARALGKYDAFLTEALQIETYASQRLDAAALPALAADLLRRITGG